MSQVVVARTSTTLFCAAASQANLTIEWTKDGEAISLPALIEAGNGVYRHNLLFSNLLASDSGIYLCTVRSEFRMVTLSSGPASLDVFSELKLWMSLRPMFDCVLAAPVSVVNSPVSTTANISSVARFICVVMGSHEVTLTWSRNGATLIGMQQVVLTISQTPLNDTYHTSSLMIADVQLIHNGTYACHARNQFSADGPSSSDSSQDFDLFVQSESAQLSCTCKL